MARDAADPLVHVNAVIEIDVLRQVMHPLPDDWLAARASSPGPAASIGALVQITEWHVMHVLVGGKSRKMRILNLRMAIPAINPQPADVMLMAERHRLLADHARPGDVRRVFDVPLNRADHAGQQHHPRKCFPRAIVFALGWKSCAMAVARQCSPALANRAQSGKFSIRCAR